MRFTQLTRAHLLTAISIGSSITLDNPMVENTLVVSTDLVGCTPADASFSRYVQLINLNAS
ncbi:MAG TPA: hypothetical protein DDZ31_06925 [Actinobacteria bacterium]|nr:hypothetical protein [Actinomycetota bacterium]